ncbi:MAG: N-acetylglutamate synthase related acetyltransferase [halophilic archaeon J07HB67]|jgi:N-acetylglutamate synthase and related acetyltransferases|nr:MAG: N-acetylglutamate synthase related acetyltransferase [halophilic archaeon J07HB67]
MYVRDARNRDEVWLLDRMEELGLAESSFRSRDYVIAVDEETDERAGFGRVRVHKPEATAEVCELTSVGVLPAWRRQGVGAHVLERLVQTAGDDEFEHVYALTDRTEYLAQFGFEPVAETELPPVLADRLATVREHATDESGSLADDPEAVTALVVATDRFEMPDRFRDRFKSASPDTAGEASGQDPDEIAEELGIDPEEATYKYDTG